MSPKATSAEEVLQALLENSKFQGLAPEVVRAVAQRAWQNTPKDAEKQARAKLHQIGGAYWRSSPNYARLLKDLQAANGRAEQIACVENILRLHASSAERLPFLAEFYTTIFENLPPTPSVTDLACGLNPLALALYAPANVKSLQAMDIFCEMLDFLALAVPTLGREIDCACCDIAQGLGTPAGEVIFLLKTLPCIAQYNSQAGIHLLEMLPTAYLVISYPLRSLGGHAKGMEQNYQRQFDALQAQFNWQAVKKLTFANELVFIVHHHAAHQSG